MINPFKRLYKKEKPKPAPQSQNDKTVIYKTLSELYKEGRLSENGLNKAVAKNWITEIEKQEILEQ